MLKTGLKTFSKSKCNKEDGSIIMNEAKMGASLLHHGYFKLPAHEAFR